MLMDRNLKPELCASRDETREHMTVLHLNVERRELVATDGHRMVVIPVTPEEDDVTGPVTVEALAAARKTGDRRSEQVRLGCNGSLVAGYQGPTFVRPDPKVIGKFPPYEKVMGPPKAKHHFMLGINARYLTQAAQALGTDDITLTVYFDKPDVVDLNPVFVRANSLTPCGEVIVMPMRTDKAG